jgi:hypothetical protein
MLFIYLGHKFYIGKNLKFKLIGISLTLPA